MMHPYLKRKFFLGLAEILGEKHQELVEKQEEEDEQNRWNWQQLVHSKPTSISSLTNTVTPQKTDVHEIEDTNASSTSLSSSIVNESIQSSGQLEEEEESFEYVNFTSPPTITRSINKRISRSTDPMDTTSISMNNSEYEDSCLHDSVTLLGPPPSVIVVTNPPKGSSGHPDSSSQTFSQTLSVDSQVELKTVLSSTTSRTVRQHPIELSEYFDTDRMCEIEPCWLEQDQCRCILHGNQVDFPMLLFALQVLDEYIAYTKYLSKDPWLVEICKLARTTLSTRWSHGMELNLMEYFNSKDLLLLGVAPPVWKIIEKYWETYRQNYLHHDELFFPTSSFTTFSTGTKSQNHQAMIKQWKEIRALLQVYGMKIHGAKKLVSLNEGITPKTLTSNNKRLLQYITQEESIQSVIHTGMDYLEEIDGGEKRHVISQSEWKIAFKAIEIHLRRFRDDLHIFPCGSFSRGAVYGSVMDVLVAFPDQMDSEMSLEDPERNYESIVQVLVQAGIVSDPKIMTRMNLNRGIGIIKYKSCRLLLDLKVYQPPKSWIALVYFTGPEEFAIKLFRELLQEQWRELASSSTNLNQVYEKLVQVIGLEKLNLIENEVHVFELAQWDYIAPNHR